MKIFKTLPAIFLITCSFLLISCSNDNNNEADLKNALINSPGQAWTDRHEWGVGNSDGFIFHADGKVQHINDNSAGIWQIITEGSWSLSGNMLTVNGFRGQLSYDGTAMTWDGWEFRRTDITISDGDNDIITREQLINSKGQAWTNRHNNEAGNSTGFILNADGTAQRINEIPNGDWVLDFQVPWSLNGNTLAISGENKTISLDGATLLVDGLGEFRKRSITIFDNIGITREQLINSPGQAWTDVHEWGTGKGSGFVIYADGTMRLVVNNSGIVWTWNGNMILNWSLDENTLTASGWASRPVFFNGTTLLWGDRELRITDVFL